MQTVSTGFTAACAATVRRPVTKFEVAWDGVNYVDESARLVEHSGTLRLAPPGDDLVAAGDVGTAEVVLRNVAKRYSWKNPASALYTNIGGAAGLAGKPVRLSVGFVISGVAEYCRIFTGVIYDWKEDTQARRMTLSLRDVGYTYLQQKKSSVVVRDVYPDAWISALAAMGGMSIGSLDAALFKLPYVWLDDESLVEEIWDCARADGGRAYFDQLGQLRFENALHWLTAPNATPQWAFTESRYKTSAPVVDTDSLATEVIVEWQARTIGRQVTLYSLDAPKTVRPGETIIFEARFQQPAVSVVTPVANTDYKAAAASGTDLTANLGVILAEQYGQKAVIWLTNSHATFTAQVSFLQLRGLPLLGGPLEQTKASGDPAPFAYARTRSVRGNMYVQTFPQADAMAQFLAGRFKQLLLTRTLADAPGVPQLELGDRVTCTDAYALSLYASFTYADLDALSAAVGFSSDDVGKFAYVEDPTAWCTWWQLVTITEGARWSAVTDAHSMQGYVTGIEWRYGKETGFKQKLSVLDVDGLFAYSDYFIIGETALGHHGRCWY